MTRAEKEDETVMLTMARDPLVVSPATPLAEAARLMRDAWVDLVAISDRGGVIGFLLRALDRLVAPGTPGE